MSAFGQKRTSKRGIATPEWTTNILAAMRILTAVLVVALAACAGSPARIRSDIRKMDPEDLIEIPTSSLCYDYTWGDFNDEKIRPELERRDLFGPREWEAIDQHKIFIGMSSLAFHCSWPPPEPIVELLDSIRTKEGPWGIRVMYEYSNDGPLPSCPHPSAVYIENDTVVAYQEVEIRRTNPWKTKWYEDWESLVTTDDSDCLLQQ